MATQPRGTTNKEVTPLYAERINMLEGLPDEEVNRYLEEHPKFVLSCFGEEAVVLIAL